MNNKKAVTSDKNDNKFKRKIVNIHELKENINYDKEKALLSFSYADDNKFKMSEWLRKNDLNDLIKCFKKVESLTWNDIKKDSGLRYKSIDDITHKLPQNLPEDVELKEIRVCIKKDYLDIELIIYFI